jgi:hypothetical protein
MLGFSSANLRRARLLNTLSTMGVMAHELRTPLATVNLMGDVLRNLVQHDVPESKRKKLDELATRLQNLVRSMNRQIDTQISNAQLMRLPREQSAIMAAGLVQEVVSQYPYRSSRERDCVQVHIQSDFCFTASRPLFAQVLTNLIKNALHALAAASTAPSPGWECTLRRPWAASTTFLQNVRPRPLPAPVWVEKKGSKMRCCCSCVMPMPSSDTAMRPLPWWVPTSTRRSPGLGAVLAAASACSAFLIRLVSTCANNGREAVKQKSVWMCTCTQSRSRDDR